MLGFWSLFPPCLMSSSWTVPGGWVSTLYLAIGGSSQRKISIPSICLRYVIPRDRRDSYCVHLSGGFSPVQTEQDLKPAGFTSAVRENCVQGGLAREVWSGQSWKFKETIRNGSNDLQNTLKINPLLSSQAKHLPYSVLLPWGARGNCRRVFATTLFMPLQGRMRCYEGACPNGHF